MSVLIKNMEMPISCDDCEFCKRASGYDWCCIPMVNGRSKPLDEPVIKPDWCPLVYVPPHGRLIDADALELASGFDISTEYGLGRYDQVQAVKHNAPTVVPAEGKEE